MRLKLVPYVVFLLFLNVFGSVVSAEEEHPAMKLVKDTTAEIKQKIKEKDSEINKDQEVLYDLVNKVVLPHFDFRKMSSWVLGKNWRKANEEQKDKFTVQFSRLLVRTYSKALHDNIDQQIDFLPIRGKPQNDEVVIRTEIPQKGGFPIPIDYKMHLVNNQWKVFDVVIDSISLVANYRTSFSDEVKQTSIDSLIAKLADRNKESTVEPLPKK